MQNKQNALVGEAGQRAAAEELHCRQSQTGWTSCLGAGLARRAGWQAPWQPSAAAAAAPAAESAAAEGPAAAAGQALEVLLQARLRTIGMASHYYSRLTSDDLPRNFPEG